MSCCFLKEDSKWWLQESVKNAAGVFLSMWQWRILVVSTSFRATCYLFYNQVARWSHARINATLNNRSEIRITICRNRVHGQNLWFLDNLKLSMISSYLVICFMCWNIFIQRKKPERRFKVSCQFKIYSVHISNWVRSVSTKAETKSCQFEDKRRQRFKSVIKEIIRRLGTQGFKAWHNTP